MSAAQLVMTKQTSIMKDIKILTGVKTHLNKKLLKKLKRNEPLSFYKHGNFIDLCRGPHVPHTGCTKHIKLTKAAGSY